MGFSMLETDTLRYTYPDGMVALNGISMRVEQGSMTALIGGNGAGKSSLLHCCNGILRPQSGGLLFRGAPVEYSRKKLEELRRQVGIVFQNPDAQLFSASVYEDISFGLCNLKLPADEIRNRVKEVMQKTGVEDIQERPVHRLSFGQKKRVALAGVLAMNPALLLLDEPTAGLDPKGAAEIMHLVQSMQRASGMTVVIATHDIEIVPLFCDQVCLMQKGSLVDAGTSEEIFSHRDLVRRAGLRLPRIGHLMEILQEKDGFAFSEPSLTIASARKMLNESRNKGSV
jgi:cobalt/nickel transport system ATP-binding protein